MTRGHSGGARYGRQMIGVGRAPCSTLWEFWSTGSAPPLRWQSQPGAFFGFVLSLLLNLHPREVKCAISRVSRVQVIPAKRWRHEMGPNRW